MNIYSYIYGFSELHLQWMWVFDKSCQREETNGTRVNAHFLYNIFLILHNQVIELMFAYDVQVFLDEKGVFRKIV